MSGSSHLLATQLCVFISSLETVNWQSACLMVESQLIRVKYWGFVRKYNVLYPPNLLLLFDHQLILFLCMCGPYCFCDFLLLYSYLGCQGRSDFTFYRFVWIHVETKSLVEIVDSLFRNSYVVIESEKHLTWTSAINYCVPYCLWSITIIFPFSSRLYFPYCRKFMLILGIHV